MYMIREDVLDRTLNKLNNGVISGEFRKCKLLGVGTGYSNSNDTPKFILNYVVEDTGEMFHDDFYFTEKSESTVIERLNNAYKAFTGVGLSRNDFIPITNLITKFESIIGKECGIKEYLTKSGFTGYQYYLDNTTGNSMSTNYGSWGENINNQNAINVASTPITTPGIVTGNTVITPINLEEQLGGNQ